MPTQRLMPFLIWAGRPGHYEAGKTAHRWFRWGQCFFTGQNGFLKCSKFWAGEKENTWFILVPKEHLPGARQGQEAQGFLAEVWLWKQPLGQLMSGWSCFFMCFSRLSKVWLSEKKSAKSRFKVAFLRSTNRISALFVSFFWHHVILEDGGSPSSPDWRLT